MRTALTTSIRKNEARNGLTLPVVILAMLIGAGAPQRHTTATPIRWATTDGGNGHAYEAVRASVTWSEANAAAVAAGGHLATIQSAAENQFVFNLVDVDIYWKAFNSGYSWGPWLGGRQRAGSAEPRGGWEWVTGEPFEYTNWRAGEPSNETSAGFQENSLEYFSMPSGKRAPTWNDFYDHPSLRLNGYVVEYLPDPSTIVLLAFGQLAFSRRRGIRGGNEG